MQLSAAKLAERENNTSRQLVEAKKRKKGKLIPHQSNHNIPTLEPLHLSTLFQLSPFVKVVQTVGPVAHATDVNSETMARKFWS